MEIVPDLIKSNLSKNQVEYIQKKQHEYKLTNKKRRVPGHILFSFNLKTKEIKSFYYQRSFNWIKRETYNEN
jgi:hypothetical protein